MRVGIVTILFVLLAVHTISPVYVVLPLFFLTAGVFKYLFELKIGFKKIFYPNKLLFLFLAVISVAILRSNDPGSSAFFTLYTNITLILFVIFFAGMAYYYIRKDTNWTRFLSFFVVLPYTLFGILNWLFHFANIKVKPSGYEEGQSIAVLLSKIGINTTRVEFPFVSGINSYSVYVGGIFTLALVLFFLTKKYRFINGLGCFIFFTTLLFTDSRGAMIYPMLITLAVYVLNLRKKERIGKWLPYLTCFVVIGPFIYTTLLPWLSTFSALSSLSRGDDDLETGNVRFFIWIISSSEFIAFKPIHLIGYGEFGHFASGASKIWAADSHARYENAEISLSPHNTFFSILFDYGYLGLIIYLLFIRQLFQRIRVIAKYRPVIAYPLLGFLFYNIIAGITESFGGVYLFNYITLFFMVAIIVNTQYYFITKPQLTS